MKNLVKPYAILCIAFALCSCGGDGDLGSSEESLKKTRYDSVKVEPLRSRIDQSSGKLFSKLSSSVEFLFPSTPGTNLKILSIITITAVSPPDKI